MQLVRMFPPLFYEVDLETSIGLMPAPKELIMLSRLFITLGVEHAMQIIGVDLCLLVLGLRGSMVTIESRNEHTRNTLKHSTCSHNWWETLKGTIFGVKSSIPGLREP